MINKTNSPIRRILYLITLMPGFCFPETKIWTGSVPGNIWNHSEHWSSNGIPGINDTALFNTISPIPRSEFMVAIIAPISIGALEFDNANGSTGYSIYGTHPLTLNTPLGESSIVISANNQSTNTLKTQIILGKDLDIYNLSKSKIVIEGNITGANKNITAYTSGDGSGVIEFSGPAHNIFSGITTIHGGTILFNKKPGITAISGDLNINSGSVEYLNDRQLPNSTTINILGSTGNATLNMGPYQDTISKLNLPSSSFINKVSIENEGKLTISGNQTDSLSVSDNSVIVGSGTLALSGPNTGITYNGSSQDGWIDTNIDFQNLNRTIYTDGTNASPSLRITGNIINGSIIKEGPGTLNITGNNTYTSPLKINDGTLQGTTNSLVGAIQNNSALSFDQNFDGVYSSVIAGPGILVKKGTGTVTLSGENIFTGGVQISEGTLAGTTLTIPGPIENNASITLNQNFDGIFEKTLQGPGSLIKLGTGTITFTGDNSMNGYIVVSEGTIEGTTKSLQGNLLNYGAIIFNQNFDGTYASQINGSGTLTKTGKSTITFNQKNTHQGTIILSDGAIQIGHNEALGSSILKMHNDTELQLLPSVSASNPIELEGNFSSINVPFGSSNLNGEISGGTFNKTGGGILELTGTGHTKGFIVSQGALQLNGALTAADRLVVQPGTAFFGTGTLHGDLDLQGILTPGAMMTLQKSPHEQMIAEYFSSDKFSDTTTIPSLSEDLFLVGNYSPNYAGGELNIDGNITASPDATIIIKFNPESISTINVNGTLTLNSPTLQLIPYEGFYHLNKEYKIISAESFNGQFGEVVNTFSMLQPLLTYDMQDGIFSVYFQLTKRHFSDLFPSGNAGQVARVLDLLANKPCQNSALVIDTIINSESEKEIKHALIQMQPSAMTSLSVIQENDLLYIRNALFTRMQSTQGQCLSDKAQENRIPNRNTHSKMFDTMSQEEIEFDIVPTDKNPIQIWGSLIGGYTNQNNQSGEPGYVAKSPGAILCADTKINENGIFGGGVGYIYTQNEWNKNRGEAEIQNIYATLYGEYAKNSGYLLTSLSGGYSFYSVHRHISFGPGRIVRATAASDFQGYEGSIDLKMGLNFPWKNGSLSPFLGVDYMLVHTNEYQEKGASSLNLKLKSHNGDLLTTEGGLELFFCQKKERTHLKAFLRFSAILESRFFGEFEKGAFVCGGTFKVDGLYPSRVLACFGSGINASYGRSTFSLSYQVKTQLKFTDQSMSAEYLWKF